jgi:hypothetical protein
MTMSTDDPCILPVLLPVLPVVLVSVQLELVPASTTTTSSTS